MYSFIGLDRSLGNQEVMAPRIFRQSAREGGKVLAVGTDRLNPPEDNLLHPFMSEAESNPVP